MLNTLPPLPPLIVPPVSLMIDFNRLTPMGDQDRIFPYNIDMILTRQVRRIKVNTNKGIIR